MTASVSIKIAASESGTSDYGNPAWAGNIAHAIAFASDTDLAWMDERVVATATSDDIDLDSVLTTPLGTAFDLADVTMIAVINAPKNTSAAANTTNLTIGGDANGYEGFVSASGTIGPIPPGGFVIIGGDDLGSVTGATGDILQIANSSGASATYQVAIFGKSGA